MHYYPFNIGDYRRQTGHLTLLEHGIYRSLLDTCYLTEEPLCKDLAKLMRAHSVRTADEKLALENVLADFFTLTENGYEQKTCNEVIAKYQEKSEKARKSANARWRNTNASKIDANAEQTHSDGNAKGMREPCESDANQEPRTINQKPLTKNQEKDITEPAAPDPTYPLFEYWRDVMGKGAGTKPTRGRIDKIKARLKDGYTPEQIKLAIDGCRKSDYHMGKNDSGKRYDCLTLICRSAEKLEQFIGYAATQNSAEQRDKEVQDWVEGRDEDDFEGNTYEHGQF
jgi:uncharacterized protein YdaU (DUF1376 family)